MTQTTKLLFSLFVAILWLGSPASSKDSDTSYKPSPQVRNFREAKKLLHEIYRDRPIDFYCGCRFERVRKDGFTQTLLAEGCGVAPRKNVERASRIEWEHVVSAHSFGHTLPCWRENLCRKNGKSFKGRKCCIRIDPRFLEMESDLHNLYPVPGELNADRGNFHFGLLPQTKPEYGNCHFKVDFQQKLAEPDPRIRGDIARTYFYMEEKYGVKLSSKNRKIYEIWDKNDPPDEWEIERNRRIQKVQGNENRFISDWAKRHP